MVEALFAGTKTQTRRILKPQPDMAKIGQPCHPEPRGACRWVWMARDNRPDYQYATADFLVRFAVGDRLWCRETWARTSVAPIVETIDNPMVVYRAADNRTDYGGPWRPAIFMPRWASRLTLAVTDVRVQRLQEISYEDAIAEGCADYAKFIESNEVDPPPRDRESAEECARRLEWPQRDFSALWTTINGAGSWDANPWIVALTFTVERRNIDA